MQSPTFPTLAHRTKTLLTVHAMQVLVVSVVLSVVITAVFTLLWWSVRGEVLFFHSIEIMDPQTSLLLDTDVVLTMVRMGEKVLLFGVLIALLSTVAIDVFSVLAVADERQPLFALMRKSARFLLSMMAVQIWSSIRSFGWIPYIGIIPYTILAPRFVFAPILLVEGEAGIIGSVNASHALTRDRWWHVMWILSILFLILLPIFLLCMIAIAAALLISPLVSFFGALLGWISIAYYCFFLKVWLDALRDDQKSFVERAKMSVRLGA